MPPSPQRIAMDPVRTRCAAFHESTGADPVGSTGSYDAFLFVEVPLPWERDISANEPFRNLADGSSVTGADGRSWRPQGLVPTPGAEGWVRVLAMEAPPGVAGVATAAGPYRRREWWVEPDRVGSLCRALLDGEHDTTAAFDPRRVEVADDVIDLMVCTHGRRDTCCGSGGTVLAEQLAGFDDLGPRGVRLWRTSHTGGHRFAPTALTFPDGYAWAHLDAAAARRVVGLDDDDGALLRPHCRGSASLPEVPAQVADAVGLERVGRGWLATSRTVTVVGFDRATLETRVRVVPEPVDGPVRPFDVVVGVERHIPQPTCGEIDGPEYTVAPVWEVLSVDEDVQ